VTVSVVQAAAVSSGFTGAASFGAPVTAGNSVVITALGYNGGGNGPSYSNPLLGGSSVTGASQLGWEQTTVGGGNVAVVAFLLPNVAGGETTVALTASSNSASIIAYEVAGLGASPSLDQSAQNSGTAGTQSAGPTGAITSAAEIVIGISAGFGNGPAPPGSPWTSVASGDGNGAAGYQLPGSAGGTYTWSTPGANSNIWGALVVTVKATAPPGPSAVQSCVSANGALTATFGSGVTAGNSIVIAAGYQTPSAASAAQLSVTSPQLGGSPYSGATALLATQSPDTGCVYLAWWLLPNIPGGSAGATSVSVSGSDSSGAGGPVGMAAWEITGLGATPVMDRRAAYVGSASAAASPSLLATSSAGVTIGAAVSLSAMTAPGSPWVNPEATPNGHLVAAAQALGSGVTPSFTAGGTAPSGDWAAGLVAVAASATPGGWRDFIPSGPGGGPYGSHSEAWSMATNINGANNSQVVNVLKPDSPPAGVQHNILLVMEPGGASTSGLQVVQGLNAQNTYNLTCITPYFVTSLPGYADNPLNPNLQCETYMLELAAWALSHYGTGGERVYLLAYSKAGFSSVHLLGRNPGTFQAGASWDYPAQLQNIAGTDPNGNIDPSLSNAPYNYGADWNFQANYELSPSNLGAWKAAGNLGSQKRLWIGGYANYGPDITWFQGELSALGILHWTWYSQDVAHLWEPDWVANALQSMLGTPAGGALLFAGII
jgi:hypothetical protein